MVPLMSAVRRLLAALFITVWVMASQHCALEAAGLWPEAGHDHGAHGPCCTTPLTGAEACAQDVCRVVEGDAVSAGLAVAKILPPSLSVEWGALAQVILPPLSSSGEELRPWIEQREQEWVSSWAFTRRAAASPRAPGETESVATPVRVA